MKFSSAIGGGVAGAAVLTLLHETTRRILEDAPRMDLLGMEAIEKSLEKVNVDVPNNDNLFKITMAGDMISNSLYYSLAGIGNEKRAIIQGTILGFAAGIGAVYLPKPLGLNPAPSNRTPGTKLMTLGLYLVGGLVAGATGKLLQDTWNK
ncbi:MAG: hypothetical protein JWQ40_294 [Segetibacter sp.]|jgi:hypothetical protein|nr:hypothetical protein [Segetibacter sp.]